MPTPAALPPPSIGVATGLPVPRFTALASNQVNLRVGPGLRFPVEWRFQRVDLPVMIIQEHEEWRRVRDPDGTEGWLAASTLRPGRRTFIVRGGRGTDIMMLRRGEDNAQAVARLEPGVIGRLRRCDAESVWCEVQVQNRRGYVRRADIFGVLPDEELR